MVIIIKLLLLSYYCMYVLNYELLRELLYNLMDLDIRGLFIDLNYFKVLN